MIVWTEKMKIMFHKLFQNGLSKTADIQQESVESWEEIWKTRNIDCGNEYKKLLS